MLGQQTNGWVLEYFTDGNVGVQCFAELGLGPDK